MPGATVTGERVTTPEGGFRPTWQRHVAAYKLCAQLLPPGRMLDLGCGVGHSYRLLAPRETVGVDLDPAVLEGQDRETVAADMRSLPFPDASFASVLSVQSIEHVPDPERVLDEVARVLEPGGVAVFVTPNRLTFGRPDEIIDPYHHVEYDSHQLRALCETRFERVSMHGLFGSDRYLDLVAAERRRLDATLRLDPLRLRRLLPRRLRQRLYDWRLTRERATPMPGAEAIDVDDFRLDRAPLDEALDLVAVCSAERGGEARAPAASATERDAAGRATELGAPAAQVSQRGPRPRSLLVLGLLLGAALIAGFTALRGVDYFDEGFVLQAARRVAAGEVPYRDFLWPYGPAQPYMLGASFELFGTSLLWWRLVRVVVVALTALTVWALTRHLAGPRAAIVAWLVTALALAQPANASPFPVALLLGLLAVAVATRAPATGRGALLAGVLAGLAATWRLDFGVYGALACAAALLLADVPQGTRVRLTLTMAGAALAVTVLAYAPFAGLTGVAELYDDLIGRSLREREWWTLPFPLEYDGSLRAWPVRGLAEDLKDVLGFYLPLIVVAGLAVGVLAGLARTRRERRPPHEWAALTVLGLAGLAYLLSRTDEFHVTPLLVVLAVLLPAVFAWSRSQGSGALAAGAAIVIALMLAYGLANRLSALLLPPRMDAIDVPAADGVRAPPAEARALERVVAVVGREVPLGQPIYVAPRRSDLVAFSAPLVYVLAERENPLREDVGLWSSRVAQERIVRNVRRARPRIVVRWTDRLSSKREPNPRGRSSGSRVLDDYLSRAYRRTERLPGFDLLVLR